MSDPADRMRTAPNQVVEHLPGPDPRIDSTDCEGCDAVYPPVPGDPVVNVRPRRSCTVDGCDKPHQGRGFCSTHLSRMRRTGDVGPAGLLRAADHSSQLERLTATGWTTVERVPDLGPCWEYDGARDARGYGYVSTPTGGTTLAHRASFIAHGGELAPDLLACHRCDNPPCINPAHLFAGTHQDNSRDMVTKGRHRSGSVTGN